MSSVGLIETIGVRRGRIPWLDRHVRRLTGSLRALGLPVPGDDVRALVERAAPADDGVVRLEVVDGRVAVSVRPVPPVASPHVVIARGWHSSYPHKTTERRQFEQAQRDATRRGGDDALLITPQRCVAEGTAWNVFWWAGGALCTPALALGVLPGIGRMRILDLARVAEVRAGVDELVRTGRGTFLVNAVRGVVPLAALDGQPVEPDARTAELSARFWPD